MNWISNLCGCLSPQFRSTVINYLNSSALTAQTIEQYQETESIYQHAKSKSYNLEHTTDYDHHEHQYYSYKNVEGEEDQKQQVIDAFWYPLKQAVLDATRFQHINYVYAKKSYVLMGILAEPVHSSAYEKIYDSQDDIALAIYCKLENLTSGKRINVYRFVFKVEGTTFSQYQSWLKQNQANNQNIEHLLLSSEAIENFKEDPALLVYRRKYKKLLVISQHQFIVAIKTEKIEQTNDQEHQQAIFTTAFSVKDHQVVEKQGAELSQGWLNLSGLKVISRNGYLQCEGYLNMELNVSVSPNMLKQPIAKQIRMFVQKLSCSIRQSDQL